MNKFSKSMRQAAVFAAILLAAVLCRADDTPKKKRPMENRFLIVIDTSSAMRSRTNGIEEAVAGLLKSDMRGEFRDGDTLGVWTYDDQIHADFPMQIWSPDKKEAIASDVIRYVHHQHYEKRGHFDKVLGAVGKIMEQSERLTVIFIYDGTEEIKGTEFDMDVNDLQKKYVRQFRTAHLPMVTVLASRWTQVFDYTINFPSAVTLPHMANPIPPPETNTPPAVVAVAPPPTNAAPPAPIVPPRRIEIVMHGTNSTTRETTGTDAATTAPSSAPNNIIMTGAPAAQQPPPAAVTTASLLVTPPTSGPSVTPTTPTESKPPETVAVTTQPTPTPVVTPAPVEAQPASAPPPTTASAPAPAHETLPVPRPAVAAVPAPAPPVVMTPTAPGMATLATASKSQQIALFVIAISLLTIAVVLVVFLIRKFRGDPSPSLISQSIDRTR